MRAKGLSWEPVKVDLFKAEQYDSEYLKLNPKGVVPTLVHDGKPVPRWLAPSPSLPARRSRRRQATGRIHRQTSDQAGSKGDLARFRYRDLGMMATIERKRAVAQAGRLKLTGFIAWVVWCVARIYFLIGFRNRLSVGRDELAVELGDLSTRYAAHHGIIGITYGRRARASSDRAPRGARRSPASR
jgi:hypothetical protein